MWEQVLALQEAKQLQASTLQKWALRCSLLLKNTFSVALPVLRTVPTMLLAPKSGKATPPLSPLSAWGRGATALASSPAPPLYLLTDM